MFRATRSLLGPIRLMRSALFYPGTKLKVLEKARNIPTDVLIFDLEDSVTPEYKNIARQNVMKILEEGEFGKKTVAVRINRLESPWGHDDLAAISPLESLHAVVVPKVESPDTLKTISMELDDSYFVDRRASLWPHIETPMGILNVAAIAGCGLNRVTCMLMGTSDMTAGLQAQQTPSRTALLYSLCKCIVAARSFGLQILDGQYLNIEDDEEFEVVCQQAKDLGFDGKTLAHPKHVEATNRIFGPSYQQLEKAQRVIRAYEEARFNGEGITLLDGKMIEKLHVEEARKLIELYELVQMVHLKR
mmetsp:Transcript_27458/g.35999  ORF Transcript_27458/g.35999 Transcript_27458/m.35999 type:complete len:304 (+) Transcript_27458:108-1019(+)